ncbi:MAG TPA: thioesterase family protein [Burkholderiales bacterium]|nr:thioesterase family protein [Burkholderiales bacterium]
MKFARDRLIRFSHCDPAGIVYFVNFFDMVGGVVEDWFREAVGLPFQEMHLERRLGFPIVNTGCEFFRPARLGDTLRLELAIAKLGRSSIEFIVRGSVQGEEKFAARHKVALVSLDSFRALPIPADMRDKMLPYVL